MPPRDNTRWYWLLVSVFAIAGAAMLVWLLIALAVTETGTHIERIEVLKAVQDFAANVVLAATALYLTYAAKTYFNDKQDEQRRIRVQQEALDEISRDVEAIANDGNTQIQMQAGAPGVARDDVVPQANAALARLAIVRQQSPELAPVIDEILRNYRDQNGDTVDLIERLSSS